MQNRTLVPAALLAVILSSFVPSEAIAQFGVVQRFLFRGAQYAGDPLFLSRPQNGPLFDFNQFTNRVEWDRVGGGYSYEFFRFFGPDTYGENTFLNLGPFQLDLTPDPSLGQSQPVGLHGRVGYSTRFIPEAFFQFETGERRQTQDFSGGTTAFVTAPIRYDATFNAGIQDFQWTGNVLIDSEGRINILGFYDLEMRIVNTGEYTADGVLVKDEQVTDFDTGPINVSGHVLFDALASLLQANGNPLTAVPPRLVTGAAQRGKTVDELMADLQAGERLTDEEVQFLVEQMFISAFLSDPLGVMFNGLPQEIPGFEGFTLSANTSEPGPIDLTEDNAVPEPSTLLFVSLAACTALGRRSLTRRLRPAV